MVKYFQVYDKPCGQRTREKISDFIVAFLIGMFHASLSLSLILYIKYSCQALLRVISTPLQ